MMKAMRFFMTTNKHSLTMKDIAKLAGVSTATVSRILNHNGRYSKETELRVKKLIEENKGAKKKVLRNSWDYCPGHNEPAFCKIGTEYSDQPVSEGIFFYYLQYE